MVNAKNLRSLVKNSDGSTPKWMTLSSLLKAVSHIVNQGFPEPTWVMVDLVSVNSRTGHCYMELAERDERGAVIAKANGMIWSSVAAKIIPNFEKQTGIRFAAGIKLLVKAKPVFKAQYGFSVEITDINPEFTLGDLEAKKKEIRDRLISEGLFDKQKKIPYPWDFNAVLVVAPEAAAGLGDFMADSNRWSQFGVCKFHFVNSRFQGEGAAQMIYAVLREAMITWKTEHGAWPDAVVIIRGGGAVNDLAWLNDYDLCALICKLPCPVFTGIGHERDSTLLDEVAHTRFDTPSKVIAGIANSISTRAREVNSNYEEISKLAILTIEKAKAQSAEYLQEIQANSKVCLMHAKERCAEHFDFILERGMSHVLRVRVQTQAHFKEIGQLTQVQIEMMRSRSEGLMREVIAQGPGNTLKRGFAIIRTTEGQVVTQPQRLRSGDAVTLEFAHANVSATIVDVQSKSDISDTK